MEVKYDCCECSKETCYHSAYQSKPWKVIKKQKSDELHDLGSKEQANLLRETPPQNACFDCFEKASIKMLIAKLIFCI